MKIKGKNEFCGTQQGILMISFLWGFHTDKIFQTKSHKNYTSIKGYKH